MAELFDRVQALPQELQDEIRRHTFTLPGDMMTVECPRPIVINSLYQPTSLLQVSHATRQKIAPTFYQREFEVDIDDDGVMCAKWLESIPTDHRSMIDRIYCRKSSPSGYSQSHQNVFVTAVVRANYKQLLIRGLRGCDMFNKLHFVCFGKTW